jgi:hypothetical protein
MEILEQLGKLPVGTRVTKATGTKIYVIADKLCLEASNPVLAPTNRRFLVEEKGGGVSTCSKDLVVRWKPIHPDKAIDYINKVYLKAPKKYVSDCCKEMAISATFERKGQADAECGWVCMHCGNRCHRMDLESCRAEDEIKKEEADNIIRDCYDLVDNCPNRYLPQLHEHIKELIRAKLGLLSNRKTNIGETS